MGDTSSIEPGSGSSDPNVISPRGVEFHSERLILAVPFLGIIAIGFVKSPGAEMVASVGVGLLGALGVVGWIQRYAASARVETGAGAVVLHEPRRTPLTIATRGAGRIVDLASVRVGDRAQRWLIWISPDGSATWTARGNRWPLEQLIGAAAALQLPTQRIDDPLTAADVRKRFPGTARWYEAHTTLAVALIVVPAMLLVAVGATIVGV